MKDFPVATPPSKSDVTIIDKSIIEKTVVLSRKSPRKRIISPLHKSASDTLHRMFNVIQPGSYIRPHSHETDNKAESIIVLNGGICVITFDVEGKILSHNKLYANSDTFGVDLEPYVIHSFYALEEDTVIFEVKPGPYIKQQDKSFARWAPEEGTPEAEQFLKNLIELTQMSGTR